MGNFNKKIIPLIDPDDENLSDVINGINKLPDDVEVWIGCSNTPGKAMLETLKKIQHSINLFPGRVDQVLNSFNFVKNIYFSNPYPAKLKIKIKRKIVEPLKFLVNLVVGEKIIDMDYILLTNEGSAAKKIGVAKIPTDEEVLNYLKNKHDLQGRFVVFLEGGSRSRNGGIINRKSLIENVRKTFPRARIIVGGGITLKNVEDLLNLGANNVILSHSIHDNPEIISKIYL